jgi:hypothetical protein
VTEPNDILELARRLAYNEIAAWRTIYQALSADLAAQLGIGYAEEYGALRIWNRSAPVFLFNRVIGLGLFEEATDAVIDAILTGVRATRTSAQIEVAPTAWPTDLVTRLRSRGLMSATSWLIHYRTLDDDVPIVETPGYRIERVTAANAAAWSDTLLTAWDFPAKAATGVLALTVPLAQNPTIICLAAIHEASGQIVGGGMLYALDGVAGLYADCVRPAYRQHHLHDALIATRLAEARRLGCDLACSQTLAHHPAEHNMAQAGFKIAYEQQNFVPARTRSSG